MLPVSDTFMCLFPPSLGVFTGGLVLLALGVLTPFFQYIPKAALAAVIMSSVIHMVDYKIVRKIWRAKRVDLIPFAVTFLLCLYDIATGIIMGILVAMVMLMHRMILPRVESRQKEASVVRINGGLSYVGIEYVVSKIEEVSILSDVLPEFVVVDCSNVSEVDYTVSQGFAEVIRDLSDHEIKLHFAHAQPHVKKIMMDSGIAPQLFNDSYLDRHPDIFVSSKTEICVEQSRDEMTVYLTAV